MLFRSPLPSFPLGRASFPPVPFFYIQGVMLGFFICSLLLFCLLDYSAHIANIFFYYVLCGYSVAILHILCMAQHPKPPLRFGDQFGALCFISLGLGDCYIFSLANLLLLSLASSVEIGIILSTKSKSTKNFEPSPIP